MHAQNGLAGLEFGHRIAQPLDQRAVLVGHGPAHRVGNVDGGRPRRHHRPANLHQKVRLRARSVLGREFHVLRQGFGPFDPLHRQAQNFVLRLVQLELPVNLGCGQENVDAPARPGRLDRLAGGVNVLRHATGQPADDRAFDLAGDGAHRREVTLADHRETGFDNVHAQAGQLAGDLQLFAQVHGRAGALLAVAQRGVEYNDTILFHSMLCSKTKKPRRRLAGDGV